MLAVDPSSVATSPPVIPNLPRLRLYDLRGCRVGDLFIVLCLRGSLSRKFVCSCHFLEYRSVQESIGWISPHHSGCGAC